MKKPKTNTLHFRIDVPQFLKEVTDNALAQGNMGVLKVPMNIFQNYLAKVAQRATEINDPKLNILMLEMNMYEMDVKEILPAIENQKNLIKHK